MTDIRSRILSFSATLATATALLAGCGQGADVPEGTTITFPPDAPTTTTGAPVSEPERTETTDPAEPVEPTESVEPSVTGEPDAGPPADAGPGGTGDCEPGADCESRP